MKSKVNLFHGRRRCDPFPIEPYFQQFPGSDSFLHAIAENPSDDDARLVFSDWLEEQGASERAELIRLQVELEKLPEALQPSGEAQRARQLQERIGWRKAPRGVTMSRGLYSKFILGRGVIADWCARHGQAEGVDSILLLLAEIKSVIDLQYLTIAVAVEPSDFERLVNSAEFSELMSLQIAWNRISTAGAKAIAASSAFTHLDTLDLWDCGVGTDGIRHLGGAGWVSRLTSLNVGCNQLEDKSARALAGSSSFENMQILNLMCNQITKNGALDLAESPVLGNLTSLNLFSNEINDDGANSLAASKTLVSLTELDMRGNPISEAGRRSLLARWSFTKL